MKKLNGHSTPVNKTAALVTSRGEHYNCPKKPNVGIVEQDFPFLLADKPSNEKSFNDFTGFVFGRLTVVGYVCISGRRFTNQWSCRCSCGKYVLRRSKSINNPKNTLDRCEECRHKMHLIKKDYYKRTGKSATIEMLL